MRIDVHQHFWRYNPVDYGWIDDSMPGLKHDFLAEHLAPILAENQIDGVIAVQARQTVNETEWLLSLAGANEWIEGVIGWIDLQAPAAQVQAQLEKYSRNPKFKGVRHVVQDEPDDQFMLRPEFLRGLSLLRAFDLAYDLLILPRHIPVAIEVVSRFPDQRFVLDHIAKPLIKDRMLSPWREAVSQLATYSNVWCKLSGMVTEAAWKQWQPADFRPYLDIVFDAFGANRLMFGSDWPVCTLSASYAQVLALIQDYLQPFSAQTQASIFGDNAAAFYKIE